VGAYDGVGGERMRSARAILVGLCSLGSPGAVLTAKAMNSDASTHASAASHTEVSAASGPVLTREDVEAWLDGFLPYALQRGDVAGGVVVVVKGGEILLQKGYGYADVASKRPVDPERTLFRAGSVAKLVTDTAVMQLVEQGKLDLDAPIDAYLDFEIPEAFGKPVTVRNLITHAGGFEELVRQLMHSDAKGFDSLETYVKKTKPARIFPPGETPSYCNYCLALTGYIIQRVSGKPFEEYLDRHIFRPLGMDRSTFRQPLPHKFAADMSSGYRRGSEPAAYYELVGPSPAGSLTTTAADMARFMIAHLRAKDAQAAVLLQPQTARLMHESLFEATPPVNGMALGFFEADRNGRRILEHGGDTQFFHSQLALFMDDDVGLFMSFNSLGVDAAVGGIRTALFQQFADRYFPAPIPLEATAATALEHGRLVAGLYASSRRAETTFFAAVGFLGQFRIDVNADGALVIPPLTALNGQPKLWREVAPFVWREVGGKERLAAQIVDGRVRFLGYDGTSGIEVFVPVRAGKSSAWITPVLTASLAALLLTVIAWPAAALVRGRYGAAFALSGQEAAAYRAVRATGVVNLLFVLGWSVLIQTGMSDLAVFDGRADVWFSLLHLLGVLGAIGAIIAIWNAWLAVRSARPWRSKIWNILLAVSCLAITWFGFTFNLIEPGVRY
jgi:CubicO group peptidase (beta-lactamase class C family)